MPRSLHIDSTALQTSGDQLVAHSAEDGVKVSAPLFADHGSVKHASTGSLSHSPVESRGTPVQSSRKLPAVEGDPAHHKRFRSICDELLREVRRLKPGVGQTELPDDWMTAAAEIEGLVEDLYDVTWGKKDALKRVVVKVESQINNAVWDQRHVAFLEDVFVALRNRFSIDDTTVVEVADLVKSHKLPLFRGTLSADNLRKQFKLVEVESGELDQ
ncbi:MAG: hypothetical protein MUF18_03800 [Fimbriiglobus sp.]|jgi:hypothetical protein|nr:hypothetical protein [Fimbriiglobus sp.]